MEAQLVKEMPDGPGWHFEPKWDGFRGVLENLDGELRLWSRNGRPLLRYFPELAALGEKLPPNSALDGEIVIERDGVLQFDSLQMRLHPAESRINRLAGEIPARACGFRRRDREAARHAIQAGRARRCCQGEAPSHGRLRGGWRALEGARGGGSAPRCGNPSTRAPRRDGGTTARWLDIRFSKETSGRGGRARLAVDSWRSEYRPDRTAQSVAAEGGPAVVCCGARDSRRSALRQVGRISLSPRHPADAFQAGQGSRSVHVRPGDATTGAGRSDGAPVAFKRSLRPCRSIVHGCARACVASRVRGARAGASLPASMRARARQRGLARARGFPGRVVRSVKRG